MSAAVPHGMQVPGVIVMEVCSSGTGTADAGLARIVTVFNAGTRPYTGDWPQQAQTLQVHPVQAASIDAATREAAVSADRRTFSVPALTAVAFVERV